LNLARLRQEVWESQYYRLHPIRAAHLLRAKHTFSRHRVQDPLQLFTNCALDVSNLTDDLEKWRPDLDAMFDRVATASGDQGCVSRSDGLVLYAAVRALRPLYVVETGVAAGVSTFEDDDFTDWDSNDATWYKVVAYNANGESQPSLAVEDFSDAPVISDA